MANGVIDTVMAARSSAVDVAAVGLGASIYGTVYVTAMGVILALSPVIGQHLGAGRHHRIGEDFVQGLWLALALAIPGCLALAWTEPWLALGKPPAQVAERTQMYLWAVAAGLPGALLFRVFYALNNALGRPKAVLLIHLLGVALKVPLNGLFIHGWAPAESGPLIPAMGGPGCALATALIAWVSAVVAALMLFRDPYYRRFALFAQWRPSAGALAQLLRLGLPIGAGYVVDVTAFTFMSLFVARFGATVGASHQITANLLVVLFMVALSIANATSVLVAQAIGAQTIDQARTIVRAGLRMTLGCATTLAITIWWLRAPIVALYTDDAQVAHAAQALISIAAAYHLFDAAQAYLVNVLRACKIVALPTLVYVVSLWGVGLGLGWWITFAAPQTSLLGRFRGDQAGAAGFWIAADCSVACAALGLAWVLRRVWREGALKPGGVAGAA
jgi:MATE family multidrug resistance protein